ncbi:ATP-binding protein [Streptomyces noursei]
MSQQPAPSASIGPSTADLHLPSCPKAASQARKALAALAPDPGSYEHGQLLITEAVANAVEHTDTDSIHVLLHHEPDQAQLLCAVHDTSTDIPQPDDVRISDPDATSGRGLHLIDTLADTWGYFPDTHGKWLWFSLTPETDGRA